MLHNGIEIFKTSRSNTKDLKRTCFGFNADLAVTFVEKNIRPDMPSKKPKRSILTRWFRVDPKKTKKLIMEDDNAVKELTDLKAMKVTNEDQTVKKNHTSDQATDIDSRTTRESHICIEGVNENKAENSIMIGSNAVMNKELTGSKTVKDICGTPILKYGKGANNLERKLKDTAQVVNSKQDKHLHACLQSDKTSTSKVRDTTTPEHSDSETQCGTETEASSDRRKLQFRRSISLRRSLFRRSQKKKQKSLELSSSGSVIATSGTLPLPLERYRSESPESCPSLSDSGIEDSDMSSKNVSTTQVFFSFAFIFSSNRYLKRQPAKMRTKPRIESTARL